MNVRTEGLTNARCLDSEVDFKYEGLPSVMIKIKVTTTERDESPGVVEK